MHPAKIQISLCIRADLSVFAKWSLDSQFPQADIRRSGPDGLDGQCDPSLYWLHELECAFSQIMAHISSLSYLVICQL